MDRTVPARTLLEPIPAHRTAGIEVVRAADAAAEVAVRTPPELANVIGSLHSSGLVALIDATGLAAIIAAAGDDGGMEGVVPLGRSASVEFLAPARGRLLASCRLTDAARDAPRPLWTREADRVRLSTDVEVADASGAPVCRGSFEWSVRRR
ncbi:DUF4442 domain-containing protein [Streptomyces sp. NPDC005799]|uniref:DUF4442 domain-containing protein n=1 Tax=Streptomyces sp. NPDC005799 TaxID=3154678 RepID=UPI003408D3A0